MMKLQETKAMKLTEGGEADAAIIRKLQLTNRSEEHTSELHHDRQSRMPSSA